jgi:hypothetical protein
LYIQNVTQMTNGQHTFTRANGGAPLQGMQTTGFGMNGIEPAFTLLDKNTDQTAPPPDYRVYASSPPTVSNQGYRQITITELDSPTSVYDQGRVNTNLVNHMPPHPNPKVRPAIAVQSMNFGLRFLMYLTWRWGPRGTGIILPLAHIFWRADFVADRSVNPAGPSVNKILPASGVLAADAYIKSHQIPAALGGVTYNNTVWIK